MSYKSPIPPGNNQGYALQKMDFVMSYSLWRFVFDNEENEEEIQQNGNI